MTTKKVLDITLQVLKVSSVLMNGYLQMEDGRYVRVADFTDTVATLEQQLIEYVDEGFTDFSQLIIIDDYGKQTIAYNVHEDEASAADPALYIDYDDMFDDFLTERFTDRFIDKDKTYDDSCFEQLPEYVMDDKKYNQYGCELGLRD